VPIPLLALAISAFAIGTTEFVIMGLLPEVARDLSVSIPSAGLLVSGYALGVAVGAPLLAVVTSRMPRKLALQLLMGVFIVGNTLCAIASDYSVLMIARVVTSFAHGSFFGIGAVVAASLVPLEKRASAIALMFTGLTLANVLGVPFGTFVGQEFGWRAAFWIVSGFGVLSLAGVTALVPNRHDSGPASLGREVRVLKDPQVWTALAMTVLGFGGVFVVFTYIAPILEQVSGFSPRAVTPASDSTPNALTIQKATRQPNSWPTNVPNGTPSTFASVRPVNISAIALARFSDGTSDAATTAPMPKNEPCANEVTTRAIISTE